MEFEEFVLAAATADLAAEPRAREHADAVEFRMDLAEDPREQLAAYDGELPVIATNRVVAEGGEAPEGEGRIDDLCWAADQSAVAAVDVELASVEGGSGGRVLDAVGGSVATVVSVHDFDGTPPAQDLRATLRRACDRGTVGKLAVTATDLDDVLALLTVTRDLTVEGYRVATMAMGETGRHSRAVAPLYGSRIGYAPVDPAEATAPGQYDLETLATLVDRLESRDGGT